MFSKILIANRGAIACRILRTLRRMGIRSVAVYSDSDRHAAHVRQADEAARIGPAPAAQSYLSIAAILEAARRTGAEAIHPGYGFLSENAGFAEQCAAAGIKFIGPTPEQIRLFGLKHTARKLAGENGLPMLPGTGLLTSIDEAIEAAGAIGYPVMLKSTAGGGGIGMRRCYQEPELVEAFSTVTRLSQANFGSGGLYLEKLAAHARHIEVQIFGGGGQVMALGERDCSAQRRNQKVIEETPALGLSAEAREGLFRGAIRLGKAVRYESAGTVEFIFDREAESFYFLEVNTRLQVEHGVTEEVTGVDLVEWMVRQAAGGFDLNDVSGMTPSGCSIQVRLYAEDPSKDFQPSSGKLTQVVWPDGVRVETWVDTGTVITPFYDPLLAKIIVTGGDRSKVIEKLGAALKVCRLGGIETNLEYLKQVIADPEFVEGGIVTGFLNGFRYRRHAVDVLDPGTQTTVQDYPGRIGFWNVGVPPSGPMDALALRLANRLVGNPDGAPGLEFIVTGPRLRFTSDTVIALAGAGFSALINGESAPRWRSIFVPAGSELDCGASGGVGSRGYLAIAGGVTVPDYLGSQATFLLGGFGGHAGRALRAGDVLPLGKDNGQPRVLRELDAALTPAHGHDWEIGVLYGPHGAPDFFTPADIDTFFSTAWKVHYNSDRTGVRLIGPKPEWARKDGGEAGLHPSNIHDNAYSIGAIDFTGDMPVILGPDGPSLGGFVCPAVVVQAELWKMGQLRPGDLVRFRAISLEQAEEMDRAIEAAVETLVGVLPELPVSTNRGEPVVRGGISRAYRASGDRYLLVEYGPNALDLDLRFRVGALERELRLLKLRGIIDITPGVRSLQIHYDSRLRRPSLLEALNDCERRISDIEEIETPSRAVYLPLSWDDPATRLAIHKYTQSVRPDAPWCPSNIEFIRRINGLASIEEVYRIVFEASYLVLGLGDVYLGAPVATPVDPRHRLVTTKYNPARTWTPENAVGIGGAYLCVYGMEGPGGYQLAGRTLQMWNTFARGVPWLLRFFDRIHFYPVSASELLEIREVFPHGGYPLRIEEEVFRLRDYHRLLDSIAPSAAEFKRTQQQAFLAERERWASAGAPELVHEDAPAPVAEVPEGCRPVRSPVAASVWSIVVQPGQRVRAGQTLVVLEAMKMEIALSSPADGVIEHLNCAGGTIVSAGQLLVTLRGEAS